MAMSTNSLAIKLLIVYTTACSQPLDEGNNDFIVVQKRTEAS